MKKWRILAGTLLLALVALCPRADASGYTVVIPITTAPAVVQTPYVFGSAKGVVTTYQANSSTGALTAVSSPSSPIPGNGIVVSNDNKYLYVSTYSSGIQRFSIGPNGGLTLVDVAPSPYIGQLYINGQHLFMFNPFGLTFSSFSINPDGSLSPVNTVTESASYTGSNSRVAFSPDGSYALISQASSFTTVLLRINISSTGVVSPGSNSAASSYATNLGLNSSGTVLSVRSGGSLNENAVYSFTVSNGYVNSFSQTGGYLNSTMLPKCGNGFYYENYSGSVAAYSANSFGNLSLVSKSPVGYQTQIAPTH